MDLFEIVLFLSGIVITSIYTFFGISGGSFWVPLFSIGLGFTGQTIFWLSLLCTLTGSLSALVHHVRHKLIHWEIVQSFLVVTIPLAIIGSIISTHIDTQLLLASFGCFLILYGLYLIWNQSTQPRSHPIPHVVAAIGALLTGLISVGIGVLLLSQTLKNKKIATTAEVSATNLAIVFLTGLVAVLARMSPPVIESLSQQSELVLTTLVLVIPGTLIGGQIGSKISRHVKKEQFKKAFGVVLALIGVLVLLH